MEDIAIHSTSFSFAVLLFFVVNWIGRHSVSFGYSSTTLFEDPNESLALNFLIRTLPPAVLMVLLSSIAVGTGNQDLRLQSYWIAIYYYALRALYFPIFNLHRLVNWTRFLLHTMIGIGAAWAAFTYLIVPQKSLLPDLETAGNELWLAMLVFVYAVSNNVVFDDSRSARRRNEFIKHSFQRAQQRYGEIIRRESPNGIVSLLAFSIIIYEGYCRPPVVRTFERLLFWRRARTTGVMQVSSDRALTDAESVLLGLKILNCSWQNYCNQDTWNRVRSVISDYNRDNDYVFRVMNVMEIIAKRSDADFKHAYNSIWMDSTESSPGAASNRKSRIRGARFSGAHSPRRFALVRSLRRKNPI